MLGAGVILGLAMAMSPHAERVVEARAAVVTFGEVVDVARLPATLRATAARLPIARFPATGRLVMTERQAIERARAQMPALAPFFGDAGDRRVVVRPAARAAPREAPPACLRLLRPVAGGMTPTRGDVAPVACPDDPPAGAFRYDVARRTVRALRDLVEGEVVTALPAFAIAAVRPGQALYLEARIGPVTVEREVRALQATRPGGRLFVRSAEGDVFPVQLGEATP